MLIPFEGLEAKEKTSTGTIAIDWAFIDSSVSRYTLKTLRQPSIVAVRTKATRISLQP
jgi:hypothetical protein